MSKERTPKKRTKTLKRAKAKIAENVGPERSRVSKAAAPEVEEFILEEARNVRERRHANLSKQTIVAIGKAKARGEPVLAPQRGVKGKSKVHERSANAYRKAQVGGPVQTRKKSVGRKTGGNKGAVAKVTAKSRARKAPTRKPGRSAA